MAKAKCGIEAFSTLTFDGISGTHPFCRDHHNQVGWRYYHVLEKPPSDVVHVNVSFPPPGHNLKCVSIKPLQASPTT